MNPHKELSFLDPPEVRTRIRKYFYLSLVLLVIIDFFILKAVHFPWELAPGFYAVYGFIACVSLIFVAKLLRLLVKRKEGYYD